MGTFQPAKPYRPNVGMIVCNSKGKVLVGERILFPGAWQFPQGGIDPGEDPFEASVRELYEELGIQDAELVDEYPQWLYYDFPSELGITGKLKFFRGQAQKWYLFYWDLPESHCNLEIHEREFTSIQYMDFSEVVHRIVEFKKPTYQILYEYFKPIIEKLTKRGNN